MNNDKVIARISKENIPGKKIEGEVIRILKHANSRVVGVFERSDNFGFVIPDDKRIYQDIFIAKGNMNGAKHGNKVVAEITKWPEKRRNPEGNVIEILGNADTPGVDILSIIRKYNLPEEFPEEVEAYAQNISEEIPRRIKSQERLKESKNCNNRWRGCKGLR
jgi:ribonuclease R